MIGLNFCNALGWVVHVVLTANVKPFCDGAGGGRERETKRQGKKETGGREAQQVYSKYSLWRWSSPWETRDVIHPAKTRRFVAVVVLCVAGCDLDLESLESRYLHHDDVTYESNKISKYI